MKSMLRKPQSNLGMLEPPVGEYEYVVGITQGVSELPWLLANHIAVELSARCAQCFVVNTTCTKGLILISSNLNRLHSFSFLVM
jgi:hypothetical protein